MASPKRSHDAVAGAAWAAAITAATGAPWLGSGYLFGTDWPGPTRFDLPVNLSSAAPAQAVLAVVSDVAGAEWTGKLLVLGALFAAGFLAYSALPRGGFGPRAAAAVIYTLNPFVYGRIEYGQYYLLLGYALLPWTVMRLRRLLDEPQAANAAYLGAVAAAEAALSPHFAVIVALLAACLVVARAALSR